MRIPDMGHIVSNPQIILDFFKNGGWCVWKIKEHKCYLYTNNRSPEIDFDFELFYTLQSNGYITQDSGNFDFHESYYRYDIDFEGKIDIDFFDILVKALKPKYKQLIRQHKMERICNEKE